MRYSAASAVSTNCHGGGGCGGGGSAATSAPRTAAIASPGDNRAIALRGLGFKGKE
jgi:hypothetical protein